MGRPMTRNRSRKGSANPARGMLRCRVRPLSMRHRAGVMGQAQPAPAPLHGERRAAMRAATTARSHDHPSGPMAVRASWAGSDTGLQAQRRAMFGGAP